MRIVSSSVAMQSDRSYYAFEETNSVSVSAREGSNAAIVTFSSESRELFEKSGQNRFNNNSVMYPNDKKENIVKDGDSATKRVGAESGANTGNGGFVVTGTAGASQTSAPSAPSNDEMMLQMLKTLILAMRRMQMMNAKKGKYVDTTQLEMLQRQYERLLKNAKGGSASAGISLSSGVNMVAGISRSTSGVAVMGAGGLGATQITDVSGGNANSMKWHRSTVESVFVKDQEHTAYSAQGMAVTADGRHLGFNVTVEMSRAFEAKYQSYTEEEYIVTDPLVINLDSDVVDVTDQKFLFDIDADGTEDEISFTGAGSGFLALDKNDDGVVNDGTELFGTKSGDGFRDLATYDTDKNGWIDEGDEIFNDLKIWTKDENGKDKLLSLKEADVGAIYLASNNTQFSLNDAITNETNAIIRKTGIYLKESNGSVGTVQHVDLAL